MRAATCTPVDFHTDEQFFGRDTGLLCRGFQLSGIDCVVIMVGDQEMETYHDVVRSSYSNLLNPDWWRARELDFVVLYAWGDPRFMDVAHAIRTAGIKLIQSLDTAGLTTPYGDFHEWFACLTGMLSAPVPFVARLRLAVRGLRDLFPGLYEKGRIRMLEECDALAAVSDPAAKSITTYLTALGNPDIAEKLVVIPHSVAPAMNFDPVLHRKTRKVLVVGRWLAEDRAQKDPETTLAILGSFLHRNTEWTAEIVGRGSGAWVSLTRDWSEHARSRLTFTEFVPRDQLVDRYQESSILLCASRFESFHISSAEALCCGCSIVVADHALLASTAWFTTRNSGTLAPDRSVESLADSLVTEAMAWKSGHRDACSISENWSQLLGARQVATAVATRLDSL